MMNTTVPFEISSLPNEARLTLTRRLDLEEYSSFRGGLAKLLGKPELTLCVDLTVLPHMSSLYTGTLLEFCSQAMVKDKKVLVRVRRRVADTCRLMGLGMVMEIEETPDQ